MARKRKGIPIHGWLILDKPLEISSNNAVGKIKWLTKAQKVGHGGTLDPLASGILPIALGEATKTVSFVMDGTKTYRFHVTWGETRNTDDAEGEVLETSDQRPSVAAIEAVLDQFRGVIDQVPPLYSAIKIDGQRAYKLARDDQEIEMKSRQVQVHHLELIGCPDSDHAIFEVRCGKGTYVRSLGRDIGAALGCLGYISFLRRTKVGPFEEKDAISLDSLADIVHSGALNEYLLPIKTVLDDIPALALTQEEVRKIRNGNPLSLSAATSRLSETTTEQDALILVMDEDKPLALTRIEQDRIQPFRVFNL